MKRLRGMTVGQCLAEYSGPAAGPILHLLLCSPHTVSIIRTITVDGGAHSRVCSALMIHPGLGLAHRVVSRSRRRPDHVVTTVQPTPRAIPGTWTPPAAARRRRRRGYPLLTSRSISIRLAKRLRSTTLRAARSRPMNEAAGRLAQLGQVVKYRDEFNSLRQHTEHGAARCITRSDAAIHPGG